MIVRLYFRTHIDMKVPDNWAVPQDQERIELAVKDKLAELEETPPEEMELIFTSAVVLSPHPPVHQN